MFLIFDNHFVNLAQMDFIGMSNDVLESVYGGVDKFELWIYMTAKGSDPINLGYTFQSSELADKYTEALLRYACTAGVANKEDMDRIYREVIA